MLKPILFSLFFLSLLIFPHAGPDTKYFLGFLRTQMGTSVTIVLVFGAKVKLFFSSLSVLTFYMRYVQIIEWH